MGTGALWVSLGQQRRLRAGLCYVSKLAPCGGRALGSGFAVHRWWGAPRVCSALAWLLLVSSQGQGIGFVDKSRRNLLLISIPGRDVIVGEGSRTTSGWCKGKGKE